VDRLSGVVCEELVYVFKWSPDTFGDCKEDWDFLRGSKEMVQSLAGER
jgi:hypothetical protein